MFYSKVSFGGWIGDSSVKPGLKNSLLKYNKTGLQHVLSKWDFFKEEGTPPHCVAKLKCEARDGG